MRAALPALRWWDVRKAQEVNRFVAISELSRKAIRLYYGRDAEVLHSPVLSVPDAFQEYKKEDFFLVVSRLERWKKLDVVIDAFRLVDAPLVMVGDGPDRVALERRAGPNVRFVGAISDYELVEYYKRARGLIHPARTEYGLTPIEANAYGTPAICWGVDGVWETLVPYSHDPANATALFYDDPTPESLADAIRQFVKLTFDQRRCYENAARFSRKRFIRGIRALVGRNATVDSDHDVMSGDTVESSIHPG
jgi:glycosyltransferase involved in cell wall biosynthesis